MQSRAVFGDVEVQVAFRVKSGCAYAETEQASETFDISVLPNSAKRVSPYAMSS